MNYQEEVRTRAEVRALYERVCKDPAIERYRGYTVANSYGWNETVGDFVKKEGEAWFENPAFDPSATPKGALCMRKLCAEKSELCALIDKLNQRIAEYEVRLSCVTEERDEARRALAALREALFAIRKLTEI